MSILLDSPSAFNANSSLSGYLDWSDLTVHFDEPASSSSLYVIGREYTIRMRGRDLRVRLTGRNPRTPKGRGFWAVNVETGNFVTVGSPAMLRPIEEPELEPSDEEIERARMLAAYDDLTAGSVPPPKPELPVRDLAPIHAGAAWLAARLNEYIATTKLDGQVAASAVKSDVILRATEDGAEWRLNTAYGLGGVEMAAKDALNLFQYKGRFAPCAFTI
jgi:hypothetical protein